MTPEEIFSTFLRVLNEAYEADPDALDALVSSRHICNQALADHPFIQVGTIVTCYEDGGAPIGRKDELYMIGLLGVINGICEPLTGRRIAASFSEPDSEGRSQLLGFKEYKPPQL